MVGLNIEDEKDEAMLLPIDSKLYKSVYEYSLVGCFLTASVVLFPAMRNTMANLWHPLGGVQISYLGERRYLFKFFHEMDIKRVLPGGKSTRCHKNIILECLQIEEHVGYLKRCGFNNGIDVQADGMRGGLSLAWNGRNQELPWIVCGDFNEILYSFEKIGGVPREERRMENFLMVLEDCQLVAAGYSRPRFTWERGNLPETNICERLDRGVVDKSREQREFQFEAWWVLEKSCEEEVRRFWNGNEVEEIAQNYFIDIFATKGIGNLEHILFWVKSCLTDKMNQLLTTKYTGEEVFAVLKGMRPTKAASSDGYPTIFFQKFWHIIGREVSNFCIENLNGGMSLKPFTVTNIVLIPKTAQLLNLTNFRPISLYTVFYKIISKIVANRFQQVLDYCIDEAQSAFVPRRLIIDNVLLAYEIIHSFKQKR
ncbi:hypothetical protein Gotri_005446, partial [Gossypium trilobum]|nr:hypothetical protein [Gossypium trilobum]